MKLNFLDGFSKNTQINFVKICPVEAVVSRGQTDTMKLITAF